MIYIYVIASCAKCIYMVLISSISVTERQSFLIIPSPGVHVFQTCNPHILPNPFRLEWIVLHHKTLSGGAFGDLDNISSNFLFFLLSLTLSFFHSIFLEHYPNKSLAPKSLLLGKPPLRWPALPTLVELQCLPATLSERRDCGAQQEQ